jgi:hypothetical protein
MESAAITANLVTRARLPSAIVMRANNAKNVANNSVNYILPSHLICRKGLVDPNGRILELLNQFRARRSAYFSRPRACPKNRGHRVPQILVMIQEGLRVTIPLKDKTLCVVAVEVQLVLQSPGVFSAHQFHASRGKMLELVELSVVDLESSDT